MGIRVSKKSWKLAIPLLVIPLSIILLAVGFEYSIFYKTNPDSLDLRAIKDDGKIEISWSWKDRIEKYAVGKDYIAVGLPESAVISNTDMTKFKISKGEDSYILKDLNRALGQSSAFNPEKDLQIFEIPLEEEFNVYIETDPEVSINDITIHYIHVYCPPMDSYMYWVKSIEGGY
jgi:hypothetical protein